LHANYVDAGDEVQNSIELADAWESHVLIPEYPGYCVAPGDASVQDVEWTVMSACFFAIYVLGVPHHRIILFGRSIGTGAASVLARTMSHRPPPLGPPAALILQSPYTSIREIGAEMGGAVGCLAHILLNRFRTKQHLPHVEAPVLILHGDSDEVIPFQHGCNNVAARQSNPWATELFVQQGCTHSEFHHTSHVALPGKQFIQKYCLTNHPGLVNMNWALSEPMKIIPREAGRASREKSVPKQIGCVCCVTCALVGEALLGACALSLRAFGRNLKYASQKALHGHGS